MVDNINMPPPASEFTNTAPYGRACVNCSRAKCKCMRRPTGGACERCLRLQKECRPAPSARDRPAKKAASRTAKLEEKLDDLVTLLRSSAQSSAQSAAPGTTPSDTVPGHTNNVLLPPSETGATFLATESVPTPATSLPHGNGGYPSPSSSAPLPTPGELSPIEAEKTLDRFRSEKLKYFPFVHLPEILSAAQLAAERPFLWLCIRGATTKSSMGQQAIGEKIRRIVAEKLIIQHEKNLEILLGLLAYMGWANMHMGPQPFLCMYTHLILGLVQDLGLDKPPPRADEQHPMACVKAHGFILKMAVSSVRSMEERRAVLATFLISAEVSIFIRKNDPLRWTPHMEECLQILEDKNESPLDRILVCMVKLRLVGDETAKSPAISSDPSELRLLQAFQTKALNSQVQTIKTSLPPTLLADPMIQLLFLNTEMEISEIGLFQTPPKSANPDTSRLASLASCVRIARAWFDIFLAIPLPHYLNFGFCIMAHLSRIILSLYRVSTHDGLDWDRQVIRDTIDVIDILDALMVRFEGVPAQSGLVSDRPDGGDMFTLSARATRTMRAAWIPVLAPERVGALAQPFDAMMLDAFSPEFAESLNSWMADTFLPWETAPGA
ncbi:hypothetical protein B0H67DRAFT_554605 [Lasiosphaeris hirsuta]|uniref:Zn(2)-C6 fungal-type domain-containing protein n=1 Tax=Lasiosphaeris hirsuta TaxID=260670 RepID=A0AA40AI60_9PEZI|nr:hypothetical protein B0H67DRAFT_554605 [Lasiosphaeris hirsuta]